MAYVGILGTAGTLICLPLVWIAYVRFKELRMRRMLSTLEWLATNSPDERKQADANERGFLKDNSPQQAWKDAQWIFHSSLKRYVGLVWRATLQDLYWANRFGAELQRLSLYPLPSFEVRENQRAYAERQELVRTHIRDFVLIANRLIHFSRKSRGGNHD
jgi:hypothetical protein